MPEADDPLAPEASEDAEDVFELDFDENFDGVEVLDDADEDLDDADEDLDDADEEDEEDAPESVPKRPADGDGEFEDEVDPDNLEADLNTILRDRIAAEDDLEDDEEDQSESLQPAELLGSVSPRRTDEWLCDRCFLLVTKSQLGTPQHPRCPSGEELCPALERLNL